MHVAVVGAGALGAVYGVRLAKSGVTTSFVVREARAQKAGALALEQIDHEHRKDTLDSPSYVTSVPADADVVLAVSVHCGYSLRMNTGRRLSALFAMGPIGRDVLL